MVELRHDKHRKHIPIFAELLGRESDLVDHFWFAIMGPIRSRTFDRGLGSRYWLSLVNQRH